MTTLSKNGLLSAALLFLVLGCSVQMSSSTSACSAFGVCASSSSSGAGSSTGGTGGTTSTSSTSPFSIAVTTYWESDGVKAHASEWPLKKFASGSDTELTDVSCDISSTVTAGSSGAINQICGVKIPETQLFHSNLELTVKAPANHSCNVFYFSPYYYLASTSATFTSTWATTETDCATLTNGLRNAACFSGPATELVTGFPRFRGFVTSVADTTVALAQKFTASSAHSKQRGDNRWTTYQPSVAAHAGTPGLVVGATQNWSFECVKSGSGLQYSYELRILADHDSSPFSDRYYGWIDDSGVDWDPTLIFQ